MLRSGFAPATVGSDYRSYTKTYAYDLAGNRTHFTLTAGSTAVQDVTYTYDDLNRLWQVKRGGTTEAAYTYDVNGSRASLTYANGVVTTYAYNRANWVTSVVNAKNGVTLSSFAYSYDANNRLLTELRTAGGEV